jgi:hypothetical protein
MHLRSLKLNDKIERSGALKNYKQTVFSPKEENGEKPPTYAESYADLKF